MSRPQVAAFGVACASGALQGCVVASSGTSGSTGGGSIFLFMLLPLLFFFLIFRAMRTAVRRGSDTRAISGTQQRHVGSGSADAQMIRAELSVLADDVLRLEPQVTLHPAARDDYESAVYRYRVAQAAMEQVGNDAPIDLHRVQRVVDEARWAMSRARAIVNGHTPPALPTVLQSPGPQGEPAVRVTDDDRPEYVGAPMSFQSGWFGMGGGLLGGLMLGSMLGGFGGWVSGTFDDQQEGWVDGDDAGW